MSARVRVNAHAFPHTARESISAAAPRQSRFARQIRKGGEPRGAVGPFLRAHPWWFWAENAREVGRQKML